MAHTPTPWFLAAKKRGGVKTVIMADEPEASSKYMMIVAECVGISRGDGPVEGANAAFIVLAVNAHDDLVTALRKAREWADMATQYNRVADRASADLDTIDAALAKASPAVNLNAGREREGER